MQVTCLVVTGEWSSSQMKTLVDLGLGGCLEMDATLRETLRDVGSPKDIKAWIDCSAWRACSPIPPNICGKMSWTNELQLLWILRSSSARRQFFVWVRCVENFSLPWYQNIKTRFSTEIIEHLVVLRAYRLCVEYSMWFKSTQNDAQCWVGQCTRDFIDSMLSQSRFPRPENTHDLHHVIVRDTD